MPALSLAASSSDIVRGGQNASRAPTASGPLMLRRHFACMCGTTPQAYRRTFSQAGTRARPGHQAEREEQGAPGQRANAHLKHDADDR